NLPLTPFEQALCVQARTKQNTFELTQSLEQIKAQLPDVTFDPQETSLIEQIPYVYPQHEFVFVAPSETQESASVNFADWMDEPDLAKRAKLCLQKCFGLHEFRGLQEEIINSLLQQQDTLAVMATGMGKSLCYQVPGMCLPGVTLVVSPLIALMEDQVAQLQANGIGAAIYNGNTSPQERNEIFRKIQEGTCKFLYVSPEKLASTYTLQEITRLPVSLIAVDEAHCVSQWGHDFRPDYRNLYRLRQYLGNYVPMLACTATARVSTRYDIAENLQLANPNVFIGDFNRPNISLQVTPVENIGLAYHKILRLCKEQENLPAIIYCLSRNSTQKLSDYLNRHGVEATYYHAGLSSQEREANYQMFMRGEVEVMVATIAFGMGVNKSNIRMVAHLDYPSTLENYYQEIGRAGRDGEKAKAVLFDIPIGRDWRIGQIYQEVENKPVVDKEQAYQELLHVDMEQQRIEEHPEKSPEMKFKKLKEVFDFCDTANCRRRVLLSAFNQVLEHDCGNCDVCLESNLIQDKIEIKEDAHFILGLVAVGKGFLGADTIKQMIMRKTSIAAELERAWRLKLNYCQSQAEFDQVIADLNKVDSWQERISVKTQEAYQYGHKYWQAVIEQLLELGYLSYDRKYSYLHLTKLGSQLLKQKGVVKAARIPDLVKKNIYTLSLLRDLETIRVEMGRVTGVRYDAILSDPAMLAISEKLPQDEEQLLQIDGITKTKAKRFGKFIFEAVGRYLKRLSLQDISAK
ncbi:RecQ family ATP-dependent DNA helicase, partial [Psittacicella gerlachiana]